MKKFLLISCLSACLMLTSCSMGNSNNTTGQDVPQGGDPAATEPSMDMNIVDEVEKMINEADAKKMVLEKVPGATEEHIREWKKETDDGKQVYDGKIVVDQTEYEFEVDARTGEIIAWETGSIND